MRSFLYLTKTSKDLKITVRDIIIADFLSPLLSLAVMMVLVYSIGCLISSTDPKAGPISYYTQVFFMQNPLIEPIMVIAACAIAIGFKPSIRLWSTVGVAIIISLFDAPNLLWRIDVSGYLSIFAGIIMMICGWRLWDYYDVCKINFLTEPRLTKPALAVYLLIGTLSLVSLIPYGS